MQRIGHSKEVSLKNIATGAYLSASEEALLDENNQLWGRNEIAIKGEAPYIFENPISGIKVSFSTAFAGGLFLTLREIGSLTGVWSKKDLESQEAYIWEIGVIPG